MRLGGAGLLGCSKQATTNSKQIQQYFPLLHTHTHTHHHHHHTTGDPAAAPHRVVVEVVGPRILRQQRIHPLPLRLIKHVAASLHLGPQPLQLPLAFAQQRRRAVVRAAAALRPVLRLLRAWPCVLLLDGWRLAAAAGWFARARLPSFLQVNGGAPSTNSGVEHPGGQHVLVSSSGGVMRRMGGRG